MPFGLAEISSANEDAACVINIAAAPAAIPHRAKHEDDEAFLTICAPTRRPECPYRETRCIGFATAFARLALPGAVAGGRAETGPRRILED